ncbi:LiaI-LiaF-like domain-containing protein [Oceanobacillus caeni]
MKKRNSLLAYILIVIGVFFLLKQLEIPLITNFYSWQTILIITGILFLFYSYIQKNNQFLFSGTIILGLGIHFYGLEHYHFWSNHWGMYTLIIGIAFIVRATKTKKGYILGILFIGVSIFMIFSSKVPAYFNWVNDVTPFVTNYWPIILIIIGIYLLKKKK